MSQTARLAVTAESHAAHDCRLQDRRPGRPALAEAVCAQPISASDARPAGAADAAVTTRHG
jgi:hypothetical protein